MKRHILLPTIGSAGDVHPVLAIALALQDRGERVTVITNGHFQQLVEGHGLDFIPLGSAELYEQVTANPDLWHPTKSFQVVAEFAIGGFIQPLYDIIAGYDPDGTLVASSGLLLGARMAYEKLGTPWITVHLQPSLLRSAYDPPVLGGIKLPGWMPPPLVKAYFRFLDVAVIDRTVAPYVNPRRTAIGLPPQKGFMSNSVHAPLQSIGLFPGWFAPPQPDWPPQFTLTGFVRYDRGEGGALSAELTTFLAAGEPRSFSRREVRCSTARRFSRPRLAQPNGLAGVQFSSPNIRSSCRLICRRTCWQCAMCRSASCFPTRLR